jgi:hypothetical protein
MWNEDSDVTGCLEVSSHIRTLTMGTEMVPETSGCSYNQLTRLIAREDFIKRNWCLLFSSVLKLKRGELRLHFRNLYVAPADSRHQPIELPDGTVLWKSNSRGWKHDQYHSVQEMDSPEPQTHNKVMTSSGSESASSYEKEIGAVGGCDLPSQISTCGRVEQQQGREIKNDAEGRETEMGECKVQILNDDCLMHIFSYLTKRDRIRIERGMLF